MIKPIKLFIFITISLLFACEKTPQIQSIKGYAQGTTYTIKFWLKSNNNKKFNKAKLETKITIELNRIDKLMSNYRKDSNIEVFNAIKKQNETINLDTEIIDLLKISKQIYQLSDGCYDPTIGPLFSAWGFRAKKFNKPNQDEITNALDLVGFNKIKLQKQTAIKQNKETTISLSAIGQGYTVAKIAQILKKEEITNYIVEIGGEMLVSGIKPNSKKWRIEVERPILNNHKVNKIISPTGKKEIAIMTSGTYRHYFDNDGTRYSHILNPKTGKPIKHNTVSTTVLLEDATKADAWSTALLCLGSKKGLRIANENKIAVIFFDLTKDNKLKEIKSDEMTSKNEFWEVKEKT